MEDTVPDGHAYRTLRESVGWGSPPREARRTAPENTLFGVVARRERHAAGLARGVGDRAMYLLIVDRVATRGTRVRGSADARPSG